MKFVVSNVKALDLIFSVIPAYFFFPQQFKSNQNLTIIFSKKKKNQNLTEESRANKIKPHFQM